MTISERSGSQNRFERHRYLFAVVLFFVLLVIGDLAVGRAMRLRAYRATAKGRATERTYRRRDSIYHHDLAPNARVDAAMWGNIAYPMRTNSLGFKDREARNVDVESTTPRVLLMGDSFTEGVGVAFDSTFAGRLAAVAVPRGVEVLNGAVASYSPIIYWRKTRDLIERRKVQISEVVVFIDISDVSDETNYYIDDAGRMRSRYSFGFFADTDQVAWTRPTRNTTIMSSIRSRVQSNSLMLYRALAAVVHHYRPPPPERPGCPLPLSNGDLFCRAGWTSNPEVMASYGTAGLAAARTHMSLLASYLRDKNIPLTIVVYPWPEQLRWGDRNSLQVSVWRDWAANERVGFVELFAPFFAAADSTSVNFVVDRYFLRGDVHWNATGHWLVARTFTNSYCLLPASGVTQRPLALALCASSAPPGPIISQ